MSSPETVATTPGFVVAPVKLELLPNPGIRVMAMSAQMMVRSPPRTIFLTGPGVCKNRIMLYLTPELCGKLDYKAGEERLLAGWPLAWKSGHSWPRYRRGSDLTRR